MKQIEMTGSPRIVVLKFRVADRKYLPTGIEYRTVQGRASSADTAPGVRLLNGRNRCGLGEFLEGMEGNYELVEAFYVPLAKREFSPGGYMAQFVFCARQYATPSPQFALRRPEIYKGLRTLCAESLWSVYAYSNPYFEDGIQVVRVCSTSITCINRMPLIEKGQSVMVWPRNEAGKPRKSGAKIPLGPEYVLRFKPTPVRQTVSA